MQSKIAISTILILSLSQAIFGQEYTVGDYVDDFSGDICFNGDGTWSYDVDGRDRVTWINLFTSWWPSCTTEAPQAEAVLQQYTNDSLVLVAFGQDWNQPYSCSGWGTTFGLSHPIVDDINNVYGLFGIGYIPHNVIIGGDGEVLYSDAGYNQTAIVSIINQALEDLPSDLDEDGFDADEDNCPDHYNPSQADVDEDGGGDACDICDNANVFIVGNVNGDLDTDNQPKIDFFDVIALLDHLQSSQSNPTAISECEHQAGNINSDNNVNIIDVVNLVNMILFEGQTFNVVPEGDGGIVSLTSSPVIDNIVLESSSEIGGFQFDIVSSIPITQDLDKIILPQGWSMHYSLDSDVCRVFAYDHTGKNSLDKIELDFQGGSIRSLQDVIVSSSNGYEIVTDIKRYGSEISEISLPDRPTIQELYPNPFNPSLTISFSVPTETEVSVTVYSMIGERVATLLNNSYTRPGFHHLKWNAAGYPSGMYFIKVQTPSYIDTKKALLIK